MKTLRNSLKIAIPILILSLGGCKNENNCEEKTNNLQNKIEIIEDSININNLDEDPFLEQYSIKLFENGHCYVHLYARDNDHDDNKYDHFMTHVLFKDFSFVQERSYDFDREGKSLEYHENLLKYNLQEKGIDDKNQRFPIELERYSLNELPSQIKWRLEEMLDLNLTSKNIKSYLKKEYDNSKYFEE